MDNTEPAYQQLEELLRTYKFGSPENIDGHGIADMLTNVRKNDGLWKDLDRWNIENSLGLDLDELRQRLPASSEGVSESAEELLTTLGLDEDETNVVSNAILALTRQQEAIADAFQEEDPTKTAERLEEIVRDNEAEKAFSLPSSNSSCAVSVLIAMLLIMLFFLFAGISLISAYKGVTPER